jgi:hypothetical protein
VKMTFNAQEGLSRLRNPPLVRVFRLMGVASAFAR